MKNGVLLVVIVVLVALCASVSYADYGVMMQVKEVGSIETNTVVTAISWEELQHPWGINHNINSMVQIALDGDWVLESRSDSSISQSFFGKIWWTGEAGSFYLSYGYIDSSFGGPWTSPVDDALIYLRQGDEPSIILNAGNWATSPHTFSGNWDFEVNYASVSPTTVPEPSSLLALGTGAIGLLGVIRRRRVS